MIGLMMFDSTDLVPDTGNLLVEYWFDLCPNHRPSLRIGLDFK